eukprot:CAMPEP_0179612956 /NCGR_PEP_ID=MMETSP0930-20121108/4796_1 /TAXON_ID=548131 ORGANISM="Ostreococcus mediterraneus, Strain clade-D-RCC1621" /NCGR_SAMPLE_ID=MMETSP0930 /ASSEMBLY_ACC=CAM_ASM_000580 /LENGTH=198 /DNA_ID=CAMNT_0021481617 /DNA_START=699 /DNA_END=1296 /DNA_ORIENTATION=-
MSPKNFEKRERLDVVRTNGVVVARGVQRGVIVHLKCSNCISVPWKRRDSSIRRQIPHSNSAIIRTAEQLVVFDAHRQTQHRSRVFFEHLHASSARYVPSSNGFIRRCAKQRRGRGINAPNDFIVTIRDGVHRMVGASVLHSILAGALFGCARGHSAGKRRDVATLTQNLHRRLLLNDASGLKADTSAGAQAVIAVRIA